MYLTFINQSKTPTKNSIQQISIHLSILCTYYVCTYIICTYYLQYVPKLGSRVVRIKLERSIEFGVTLRQIQIPRETTTRTLIVGDSSLVVCQRRHLKNFGIVSSRGHCMYSVDITFTSISQKRYRLVLIE